MKKSERKKGFPGLRRAGSLAGRGPMPAAPGSFLVGPSFLGVVETTKEIITYVLASCKHEFQQPKRWTKSGSKKSSSQSTKFLMIPGFCAGFRLLRNTGNTENSYDVLCIFSGARWGSSPQENLMLIAWALCRTCEHNLGPKNLVQQQRSATLERYGFPTDKLGSLAQLVRALASHARGRQFESAKNHHLDLRPEFCGIFPYLLPRIRPYRISLH